MNAGGIVLHVGLPKTGTTTLQRAVFPNIAGVTYLGKSIPTHAFVTKELANAIASVVSDDSVFGDPSGRLAAALEASRESAGGATTLVSTEALAHPIARDLGLVARRLRAAAPDASVLITLRAQDDLALSWYRSHGRFAQFLFLRKGESERIPASLSQQAWWALVQREPRSGLAALLDFDALVHVYEEAFEGRVTVLPLELLAREPAKYAARLADALGVARGSCESLLSGAHENRGLSAREVLAARALSLVGLRTDFLEHRERNAFRRMLARGPRADGALDAAILAALRALHREGNARLAARHSFDARELWPHMS